MSPDLAFFVTAGTDAAARACMNAAAATDGGTTADECMCGTAEGELDALESTCIGAEPAPTTRTLWSSYPGGVDGGALDAGDVDVDMEDSGVSGVPGVCGDDDCVE